MQNRPSAARFILDNLGWVFGSIALAVFVWYAAVSGSNPVEQRRFATRLPIEFKYDEGLLVSNRSVQTGQVTIRALQSVWDAIDAEDIKLVADLSGQPAGKYQGVRLNASLIGVRGGTIIDISPSTVDIELARKAELKVNITVQVTQDPPVGFFATTTTSLTAALVSGPEDKVNRVAEVQARINLADRRTGQFPVSAQLYPVDAEGKDIADLNVEPARVSVEVNIQPRPDSTELLIEPTFDGQLPSGYYRSDYNWEPKLIVVRGDQTTIEELNGRIRTEPIDLTGQTRTFTRTVKLALPEGVTMPDPKDVTVTVRIEPILSTREFVSIPVQHQGIDPALYNIELRPDRVNVIVTGPQSVVNTMTANDISVFAPLGGLSVGQHIVSLQVSITKPEVENFELPVSRVEVNITSIGTTGTPEASGTASVRVTVTPSVTPSATPPATSPATEEALEP